uniref:YvlB/LiaX N-terminal domain-containing protein n=1 Tax=candidate division WOR-3 bacterium TaxID=2052148 RepID=A0A7V0Z4V9_UNCW3
MRLAIIIIFIAVFFWLANLKVLLLTRDWPIILIFFGVINLFVFPKYSKKKVIENLEKGKITPEEALKRLERLS